MWRSIIINLNNCNTLGPRNILNLGSVYIYYIVWKSGEDDNGEESTF